MQIKICGITKEADMQLAGRLGYHGVGLVFVKKSPRYVRLDAAVSLAQSALPLTNLFAVFMNPTNKIVRQVVSKIPFNSLQFHGDESEPFCSSFGVPYLKSLSMAAEWDVRSLELEMKRYPSARGFILDSHRLGEMGGQGKTFDWKRVPDNLKNKVLISGGLNDKNILLAGKITNVYQFDLSSGVENKDHGKSQRKLKKLIKTLYKHEIQNI